MPLHGIFADKIARNSELAGTLRTDHVERFSAVPRTVMINPWPDDLDWIVIDSTYPAQIARRHALLLDRQDMVIDRLPGTQVHAAELELRDMVVEYLVQTWPRFFLRDADLILSPLTGLAIDVGPNGADPLHALALLASEDMLLLLPEQRGPDRQTVYVLKSGALLFPNDWSLRSHFKRPPPDQTDSVASASWLAAKQKSEKAARLGKSPMEIHDGHVSHYMQNFSSRVDLFFDRMEAGARTWRRNWGPRMSDELFLHSDALPSALPAFTPENWGTHGYLRSEHETFTKLPATGGVVFSIKTYLWKLSELMQNPVAARALFIASDNLAPSMFEYRAESLPTFKQFLEQSRRNGNDENNQETIK
jgi:hypothetical protein